MPINNGNYQATTRPALAKWGTIKTVHNANSVQCNTPTAPTAQCNRVVSVANRLSATTLKRSNVSARMTRKSRTVNVRIRAD